MNWAALKMDGDELIDDLKQKFGATFVLNLDKSDDLLKPVVDDDQFNRQRFFLVTLDEKTKVFEMFIVNINGHSKFCKPGKIISFHQEITNEEYSYLGAPRMIPGRIIGGGRISQEPKGLTFLASASGNDYNGVPSWIVKQFVPALKKAYPTIKPVKINTFLTINRYFDPTPAQFFTHHLVELRRNLLEEFYSPVTRLPAPPAGNTPANLEKLRAAMELAGSKSSITT